MAINKIRKKSGNNFEVFFDSVQTAVNNYQDSYTVIDIAYSSMYTPRYLKPKEYTAIIMLENKA